MTVLKEVQPRIHALTGGFFANWMPPDKVEVGDYGVIARQRFVRDGNLANFGIDVKVETPNKSKGSLKYSDRARISIGAAAAASMNVPGAKSPKATAQIKFTGSGAFLYQLSGITTQRLENSESFFRDLAKRWLLGEITLENNAVIVTELRMADKATIVVSEGRSGELDLQGYFDEAGDVPLARVKGGLKVSASSGSMFQWLAADNTIPIIGLVRPILGPPGGDPTPGGFGGLLAWVRELFQHERWDIREIELRTYTAPAADAGEAKMRKLSHPLYQMHYKNEGFLSTDDLPLLVGFASVTASDFAILDERSDMDPIGIVEDLIEEIKLEGPKKYREAEG